MDRSLTSTGKIKRGKISRRTSLACLTLIALLSPGTADAASRTWDGGCGGETSWSCAGNWSGDVIPSSGDTATFIAKSPGNSTVDSAFPGVVATIKTSPGYDGTIALARSLTVSKTLSQQSGTFNSGDENLALKAFVLSGGTFVASSGTTSVAGALKISGAASFHSNGGTVEFNGGSGALTCGGVAFNLVAFSHTSGTKTVGSDCDLPLGSDPDASSGGSIKLNGAISGKGTLRTSGTLTLGEAGSMSGISGLVARALTVGGTGDFGAYTTFKVGKAFVIDSGSRFTAPAGNAFFAGNFNIDSNTKFDANGGTLVFDGAASSALSCGDKVFNLVDFTHTAGKKTIGSDCSLPLGKNPTLGDTKIASVSLDGALSGTGTLTAMQPLVMNGTSSLSGFRGLVSQSGLVVAGATLDLDSYGLLAVNGNYRQIGGTVTAPDDADFNGQFKLNSGATFGAPRGTITMASSFTVDPGASFVANGGTVTFDGSHSAALSCGKATFNLVTFSHAAGTKIVDSNCSLPLGTAPSANSGGSITLKGTLTGTGTLSTSGTLTLGGIDGLAGFSGLAANALTVNGEYDFGAYVPFSVGGKFTVSPGSSFTAPVGVASFAGDFVDSGGSFVSNGGTVDMNGGDQQLTGDTSFSDLTKRASSAATLTLAAGNTVTARGTLTLEGAGAKQLLTLASSTPGKPWLIDARGKRNIQLVAVADSTNRGEAISAFDSVDDGGNTGWSFR